MQATRKTSKLRRLWVTFLVIASTIILLWLADSTIASRAEHKLSSAVGSAANLPNTPRVSTGSGIYSLSFITGKLDDVSIDILDVEAPGLGTVNARTDLKKIEAAPTQLLNGDFDGSPAEFFSRTIRMDGVAVGNHLGMTDLNISHPMNISPSGGTASEALLTGTPPGFSEPVSVVVTLRLVGPEFQMVPIEMISGANNLEEIKNFFTWRVSTDTMPLADRAMAVYLQAGSIHFASQARNLTITTRDLSPLAAPRQE